MLLGVSRKHCAVAWRAAIQFNGMLFAKIDLFLSVAAIMHRFFKKLAKLFSELWQIDPVLRPLRSGDARLHVRQIQIDINAVIDFAFSRYAEHVLGAKIIFESKALLFAASGSSQIIR